MLGLEKITNSKMRKGTKFAVLNFAVVMILISFMIVGLSLVVIFANRETASIVVDLVEKLDISSVITALVGQSGAVAAINSIRIGVENYKNGRKDDDPS